MKAAVLIDGENVVIALQNILARRVLLDKDLDWEGLFEYLKTRGYDVTIARIYANPFILSNPHAINNLEKIGIRVVLSESTKNEKGVKNTTDATMIVEGMEILYERPAVDTIVIVSGDRDFIPLADKAKELGKEVLFASFLDSTAKSIQKRYEVINLLEFGILNESFGDNYFNSVKQEVTS